MFSNAIAVGPEFFQKAKNDYANWRWAIVREFMQNCIDAPGSTQIDAWIDKTEDGQNTILSIGNNGEPMSREILVGKLLSLGGSGKNFQGTVGGFGKAKEILYYCHESYKIHTGDIIVEGAGGGYNISPMSNRDGTCSDVVLKGNEIDALKNNFKHFVAISQWSGKITLNGETLDARMKKGARRKEFKWGVVYTNNTLQGRLVCRIGGVPMFSKPISYKATVLIELTGESQKVLTANRDGLTYDFQEELDEFIATIAVNTRTAFKDWEKPVEKKVYAGYKLAGKVAEVSNKERAALSLPDDATKDTILVARIANTTQKSQDKDAPVITAEKIRAIFRPEFHIRSEIGGKIPDWFLPEGFSDNSKRLVSNWIALLVEFADMTKNTNPFAVGFVFDPDCEALWARDDGNNIIYVSPATIVEKEGKPRQLKVKWKFDAAGNWRLLAIAAHEWVHHEGYHEHNEDYANRLTEVKALVLANRTRFSRHFSAPVAWPE